MRTSTGDPDERFRLLYATHFPAILGYALRRTGRPEDAADVVAETFLVAWRRLAEVPSGGGTRLWLYGVARRVLANQRRGERRRERLGQALAETLRERLGGPDPADAVVETRAVRVAMERLGEVDREVLRLTAWEGLEPREIATVLGISAHAVRTRLHRARSRLREQLGDDDGESHRVGDADVSAGHVPGNRSSLIAKEGR